MKSPKTTIELNGNDLTFDQLYAVALQTIHDEPDVEDLDI